MSTNLKIALRFLLFKKRAMLMTLSGIIFGVAFFILTQAQTSGFEQFFIRTILGTDSALRVSDRIQMTVAERAITASGNAPPIVVETVRKYIEGVEYPIELKKAIRAMPETTGVAEVLRGSVKLDSNMRGNYDAQLFGINIKEFSAVSNLEGQIISGSLEEFGKSPQGILLASRVAIRVNARIGDVLNLTAGKTTQRFTVMGVFETGVGDIDKVRVIVHTNAARSLLNRPFGATYLQVALEDPDTAPAVARRMQEAFRHRSVPWQESEKVWLEVFRMLRFSSAITVSTIILVSALGMFNTLAMLVIEKTREIAILRSFGFSKRDVTSIFLWLGWLVITLGTTLGCAVGALLTWATGSIPLRIRGIFSTDHFIVSWNLSHYAAAVCTAVVVVFIASYFPARRAALIEPGDIIRGASS
ncbi:MAG: ABC transporter permease [Puniceicoccales bacterium]|jgi:lipoprotein-releasing system permease protein|nr:ABC transporter permease [Puniceicoccales bacterium]